ncbi:hypothetical protein FQR65_LT18387 [Abscondita terminalis]|nr:hypothetical protein FQR65_LT18387 [Abscondita terminalis]
MSKHFEEDERKKEEMLKEVRELQVRDSDIFLLGYPKSGTTWAQEMIWLIANDLDYEGAKVFVDARVPVIEMSAYICDEDKKIADLECHWNSAEFVKKMKDPRCIKTHMKWDKLPTKILDETSIIYIARNPKDVCLSSYRYLKDVVNVIDCTFDDYSDYFIRGYRFADERYEDYWNHVLYFWERRNRPNVLFIKYEEMKRDLANVIRKVATLLDKTLTDNDVLTLVKWLDFETMKTNEAVNHNSLYQKSGFMRTGKDGEHKKVMKDKIIKKFDSWIEENLKYTDYEL